MTKDINKQFAAVKKSFGGVDSEKMADLKEKGKKVGKIGKMMQTGKGGFLDKMRSFKPGLLGKALAVITGLPLLLKMPAVFKKVAGGFKKILPAMSFVFSKAKVALMYFLMGIVVVFLVVKVIQMMWSAMSDYGKLLKEVGLKGAELGYRVKALAGTFMDWLGALWKIVYSVFTGDFDGVIDGLIEFAITTGYLLLDLLLVTASLLFTLAVGLFLGFVNWIRKPGHMEKLLKGISTLLGIWGAWILVKWIVAAVTSYLVGFLGLVPMLVAAFAILIVGFFVVYWSEMGALLTKLGDGIVQGFKNIYEGTENFLRGSDEGWKGYVPLFADGGISKGGLAVVGEEGPELVDLPRGASVNSNEKSKALVSGHSINNTINIHMNGRIGASDREIRDIARKVGQLVNTEINRTTSSSSRLVS